MGPAGWSICRVAQDEPHGYTPDAVLLRLSLLPQRSLTHIRPLRLLDEVGQLGQCGFDSLQSLFELPLAAAFVSPIALFVAWVGLLFVGVPSAFEVLNGAANLHRPWADRRNLGVLLDWTDIGLELLDIRLAFLDVRFDLLDVWLAFLDIRFDLLDVRLAFLDVRFAFLDVRFDLLDVR